MTQTLEPRTSRVHEKARTGTSVRRKKTSAKLENASAAKTFDCAKLESSFIHFCQLVVPELHSEDGVRRTAKQLLETEVDFIDNAAFSVAGAASQFFDDGQLIPREMDGTLRAKTPDLPSHLARLCEAKLLSADEERVVFLRMNFLKHRANELRQEILGDAPCSWTVRRIEALLKAADWYRDRMVKANMRLVISIVKKFVNKQNGFDDLLSDGIVALLRAVEKFDIGLGFRFSTYATQVVRRNTYRRVMEKQKERQRITLSIHDPGIDISDEHRSPAMSEVRWQELRGRLSMMLDQLDRREKLIVRARFSLGGHRRVQTLQRLADKLGVSKERVRQLEKRALDKLRDMVVVSPLPEIEV